MIFFSISENKAFVLFCQRFIIVKCMDFSFSADHELTDQKAQ